MGFKQLVRNFLRSRKLNLKKDHPADAYTNLSFSQEGEDLILKRLFGDKKNGFYIDVGAHHPFRFSNTYLFYKEGWRGINIDAMPGSMELFNQLRPGDINLEIPVSAKKQVLKYHIFNEPALNTFSEEEASKKNGLGEYKILRTVEIGTRPLAEILDQYLPAKQAIDFISIDVEGLDYDVLRSNNWDKYRPTFILIESLRSSMEEIHGNEVYNFLQPLGYQLLAKTYNTLFFKSVR